MSYMRNSWTDPRTGEALLGTAALVGLLVCIINCFFPQVEMALTGGNVPLPQGFIKVACFGFLVGLVFIYRTLDLSLFPTKMWLITVGYLMVVFIWLWQGQNKRPSEIFLAYNAYYCPLIFAPLAAGLRGRVSQETAFKIFMATFATCALLGWVQYVLQEPIIRLASNDGNFRIYLSQWMVGGYRSIRANSFFAFAQEYGSFVVLIAAIGIGMCRARGGWKLGVPLYLFAAATCYTTMTRAAFLQLFVASIAALTFTFGKRNTRVRWQPLIAFAASVFIAFSGLTSIISQKKSIYDDVSLQQRLDQWQIAESTLSHSSAWPQLLGLGYCQADKPVMVANKEDWNTVLLDNMYVALALHIGLIGMAVIVGFFSVMWSCLQRATVETPTPVMIGIASYWSTFAMTGMFNIQMAQYGFWFLIALVVSGRPTEESINSWEGQLDTQFVRSAAFV